MSTKKVNIQEEKKFFVVVHNGSPIFKITKDIESVVNFLGGLSSSELEVSVRKKTKKKTTKKKVDEKKLKRAIQLEKKYRDLKKDFYKTKLIKGVSPSSSSFVHFLKAVDIMERTDIKIKVFMKAQIEGLKFVGGGQGTFPKVNQLSTDGAEQRVLEYLRNKNMESVELTDEERRTNLMNNKKYKKLHRRVKNGDASLIEALYVRECQLARRDETQKMVEDYIKQLKK